MLKSKIFIYQNDFDALRCLGISGDQDLTADRIRCFAVETGTCFATRSAQVETLCVDRRGFISCTGHGRIYIACNFIHSDDHQHIPWSGSDRGYTVGMSVNIDHNSIFRDRICTGQKVITIICRQARSCAYLPVSVRYRGCIHDNFPDRQLLLSRSH